MAGKKDVNELSDFELMNELKSLGLKTGPITPNTRWLFEKRLSKARGCDVVDSSSHENKTTRANEDVVKECTNSTRDSTSSTPSPFESPAIFYGVCFDVERSSSESASPSLPAVFTSKDEALKVAKKVKGARFKGFKSKLEAECFSRSRRFKEQEISPATPSALPAPTDPVSSFKSPTPQELVKFRTVIERGSKEEFQEVVFKNPRYLIGPGDTPVILQEGSRYNALHVAVKSNRKEMCQLIIETLESQHFWNILLKQETESAIDSKRKQFLVDMYLNTPDKGNWETPLHFACKFGHVDIVEYLVSHPLTDVQRPNKYGETPAQVICSRCSKASSDLKSQIKSCLEDSFYVPLLGTMDNSTPPWIGGPWSPEVTEDRMGRDGGFSGSPLSPWKQKNSPGELPITVRAYAGPMSPSKAEEFYHSWKTPPKPEQRSNYIQIKRKDDSRGVERIGRDLAHYGRIAWTEYWNFLGCYADLSSSQGLEKLEDYLAKKKDRVLLSRLSVTPQRVRVVKSVSSVLKTPKSMQSSVIVNDGCLLHQTGDITDFDHCNEIDLMDLNESPSLSSRKVLFSDSEMKIENSNADLMDSAQTGKLQSLKEQHIAENFRTEDESFSAPLDKTTNSKSHEAAVETLAETLDTLFLHQEQSEKSGKTDLLNSSFSTEGIDKKDETDNVGVFPCRKKLSYNLPETKLLESRADNSSGDASMEIDEKIDIKSAHDRLDIQEDNKSSVIVENATKSSSVQNQPLDDLKKNLFEDDVFENAAETDQKSRKLDQRTGLSDTGQHSFKIPQNKTVEHVKSVSCSNILGLGGKDITIFIQGLQPSKLDLDVLLAIGQENIDSGKFPCIAQWKKLVTSYSEATQQSWPSPGSPRYHARHKSLMWSC
ncbi:hypothetical protein ACROYT_G024209 [Oculina patagonica]